MTDNVASSVVSTVADHPLWNEVNETEVEWIDIASVVAQLES